jgi:hypothetical protein
MHTGLTSTNDYMYVTAASIAPHSILLSIVACSPKMAADQRVIVGCSSAVL